MKESEIVNKHNELYNRSSAVGLTLKSNNEKFEFNIKEANGLITMNTLDEVELFIRGYELAYHL